MLYEVFDTQGVFREWPLVMLIQSEEPNVVYSFADEKLDSESNATIWVYI